MVCGVRKMNSIVDKIHLQGATPLGTCASASGGQSDLYGECARSIHISRFSQHDTIYFEGDQADSVCQVIDGAVMLYKLLPDGRRQVVELLGPNDIFGFAQGASRDCSAETLVPTQVRFIDRRSAERSCSFQRMMAQQMLTQFEAMHEHAMLLGRKSAIERVASFLLQIISADQAGCRNPVLCLTMTRQEIADYLGLTIETVSRSFSELRRRNWIVLEKQDRVRIANYAAVEDLATAC